MTRRRIVALFAVASATLIAIACSVEVDIANKQCPCGDGYVCDTSRNICVTPENLGALDAAADVDAGFIIDPDGNVIACPDDKCPCVDDNSCKEPARRRCLAGTCVECLRDPVDTCPAGSYCNEQNQCTLGCKVESDCQISPAVPHCNLARHQCVECVSPSDCGDAGLLCSPSGACVPGCDLDAGVGCTGGRTCCGNFCLNLLTDLLNCGACENKCNPLNGSPTCANGNCTWPNANSCNFGWAHCGTGNTGCETNIRQDVTKCGSCTRSCLVDIKNADNIQCAGGTCTYQSCKPGFGNCNANAADGCECPCGSFVGDQCCPGGLCTYDGGKCVGNNKCQ